MPTYRALYSREANVVYDGNDSTGGTMSSDTRTHYFAAGYGAHGLKFTLANNGFSRTGFTFVGWMLGSNTSATIKSPGDKITYPNTAFFARATKILPGPTILSTLAILSVPKARAAMACAPPHL